MNTSLTRLRSIKNFPSLVTYLRDELDWEFETEELEDLTFDYDATDFNLDTKTAAKVQDIKQLRPLVAGQPWGIFYLDFAGQRLSVAALRGILRGLVAKKRASANSAEMRKWQVENLLFICTSDDFQHFNFAYFRGAQTNRAMLATFGWQQGDTHLRTLAEYNLPALRFPSDTSDTEGWLKKWREAFDVEKVTDKFFADYRRVFESVEREVKVSIKSEETARLYTQRLFNRLMFLYFIQKKGWLEYEGDKNYLRALFNAAESGKENFLRERLYYAFFWGMSNVGESRETHTLEALQKKRGRVPYLNGGLFDIEDDYDSDRDKVKIPNDAFRNILDLFERYNFTVEESTPLDVQVAVDPEMLGKVFEELVTGRHESGSYYTPRQIVSFMCREALKHCLKNAETRTPVRVSADVREHAITDNALTNVRASANEVRASAIDEFVDEGIAENLSDPEAILERLKKVRVCDPACGSGAYLLGMMQELVRLRGALFVARKLGDDSAYKIKRSIIENNLYGVDKDQFAVQIAALRLWLSLAIDAEKPQPLPNLDFKIGCGDSLVAPAPSANEKTLFFNRRQKVREYVELKRQFSGADGERKRALREQIESLRVELAEALKHTAPRPSETKIEYTRRHAEDLQKRVRAADRAGDKTQAAKLQKELQTVKRQLAVWDKAGAEKETGFDWAVEFAEVFMPEPRETWRMDDLHSLLNDFKHQGTLLEEASPDANSGGFDIVLANPPYVRHKVLGREYKEKSLKTNYKDVFSPLADLYVYFFARAQQLLKVGGVGCFISSNKWLQQEYGENLRQELLDKQAFHLVVDFGELPVFKSVTAYTAVFLWQKIEREEAVTSYTVVEDLEKCYAEGIRECITRIAQDVPASQFGSGKSRLSTSDKRTLMDASGQPLGELASAIFVGLQTSADKIYILDLVKELSKNRVLLRSKATGDDHEFEKGLVKPLLSGADVKRYQQPTATQFIIFPYEVKENRAMLLTEDELSRKFPLAFEYLSLNKTKLEARENGKMEGDNWYGFGRLQNLTKQELVKLCVPRLVSRIQTIFDSEGKFYLDNVDVGGVMLKDATKTNYYYVLAVLNSGLLTWYLTQISTPFRGGFYSCNKQYLSRLPIPDAPTDERERIAELAREAQGLHTARRQRVEQFLRDAGTSPAASSSRNPLEQPWTLAPQEFARRAPRADPQHFTAARDETLALNLRITKIEREIDERVAALYGVGSAEARTK